MHFVQMVGSVGSKYDARNDWSLVQNVVGADGLQLCICHGRSSPTATAHPFIGPRYMRGRKNHYWYTASHQLVPRVFSSCSISRKMRHAASRLEARLGYVDRNDQSFAWI